MNSDLTITRTCASHPDFIHLISLLDHELWNELNEDQETYNQYNNVSNISTAVIVYADEKPIHADVLKCTMIKQLK